MERKRYTTVILTSIIAFFLAIQAFPQKPVDCQCKFYQAYLAGEMDEWETIMNDAYTYYQATNNPEFLMQYIMGSYGYIPYLIENEDFSKAKEYINRSKKMLARQDDGEYLSFLGAFIAYEIGIHVYKAVYLGPKSMAYINESIEVNAGSPYGWLEKGNAEFHMPRAFGGSYHEAANNYLKAIQKFEQNKNTKCNWIYLNTKVFLAFSYQEMGKEEEALSTYKEILEIAPDFKWVKNELYPELLNSR